MANLGSNLAQYEKAQAGWAQHVVAKATGLSRLIVFVIYMAV
jgi:hypothetical protein